MNYYGRVYCNLGAKYSPPLHFHISGVVKWSKVGSAIRVGSHISCNNANSTEYSYNNVFTDLLF